ncbi:hypothetical protein, partial [Klebsiella pneumoniae]
MSVSEEIVEILTNGTVKHAVNAPKMDLNNVDENIKNFVDLSTTIGEFGIQLLDGTPSEIKITFAGN